MLKANNLVKRFGDNIVLNDVSIKLEPCEVVAVIGRSGSGKSTLLRCINHLEMIDGGSIEVEGELMASTDSAGTVHYARHDQLRRICLKMGMVFQGYNLFPHFTVLKNITEAQVHVLKRPIKEAQNAAYELLARVGLSDKAKQYPCQLSGGQCQRVAIARALALNPSILCFDEPTSALDPQLTLEVLGVIRDLASEHRTMIVVTHEMAFARDIADRVILMADGVVVEEGSAGDLLGKNRSNRMKNFLGENS